MHHSRYLSIVWVLLLLQGCGDGEDATATFRDCDDTAFFTTALMDVGSIQATAPMGTAVPMNKPAFPIPKINVGTPNKAVEVPIVAPTRSLLANLSFGTNGAGKQTGSMGLIVCGSTDITQATVTYGLGHITDIPQSFKDLLASTRCDTSTEICNWEGSHEVAEGEQIATYGGVNNDGANLDVEARDARTVNLPLRGGAALWSGEVNAVCPFDLYSDATMKESFYNTLEKTTDPKCGELAVDVANTARGRWFDENYDFDQGVVSTQSTLGLFDAMRSTTRSTIVFSGNGTYQTRALYFERAGAGTERRDFRDITVDSTIYCYDTLFDHPQTSNAVAGHILVQLTEADKVKVEYVAAGNCPGAPSFSNPQTFIRPAA